MACGLLAVAALTGRHFSECHTPQPVEPRISNSYAVSEQTEAHKLTQDKGGLIDLGPWLEILRVTEQSQYEGSGRNLFQLVQSPRAEKAHGTEVPRQDPPLEMRTSPVQLRYFGFARKGDASSIFLLKDEDVFIVHVGEILDRRYKVARITATHAELEDLLSNPRQTLRLRQMR